MQNDDKESLSFITLYFQNFYRHLIRESIKYYPQFKTFLEDSTNEAHFKILWNIIVEMMIDKQSFQSNLASLSCFTLFTPAYSLESINFLSGSQRLKLIAQRAIEQKAYCGQLFHVLVQIIIPQCLKFPENCLKIVYCIFSIIRTYEPSLMNPIKQFIIFLEGIQNMYSNEDAEKVITLIDNYFTYREESRDSYKFPTLQYANILKTTFKKTTQLSPQMINILKNDPFIFTFLKCEVTAQISNLAITPFSMIAKSGLSVPKYFYMHYRSLMIPIINFFLIFRNDYDSIDSFRKDLIKLSADVLNIIESGPAGRDAFLFLFLHFYRTKYLRPNIESFISFITCNPIDPDISLSYFNAVCTFVFSFDSDIFPSTITLINDNSHIISETLLSIIDNFESSPFREKAKTIYARFACYPEVNYLSSSLSDIAMHYAYYLWRNKKCNVDCLNVLSTMIKNSAIMVDPTLVNSFLQLAYAFFSHNTFCYNQIPFYCKIASSIISIGTNLPDWHLLSIRKENILKKLTEGLDFLSLFWRFLNGFSPSLFLGAFIIFSRKVNDESLSSLTKIYPFFLPMIIQKAAQYEIAEVLRISMRVFDNFSIRSVEMVQIFSNILIENLSHGFRTFMRFAAPLFKWNYFIDTTIKQGIYIPILLKIAETAKQNYEWTISFINIWRSFGTFYTTEKELEILNSFQYPEIDSNQQQLMSEMNINATLSNSKKFRAILLLMINLSSSSIFKINKNINYFYESLSDILIIHKSAIFMFLQNIDLESDSFKKMISNLPNPIGYELIARLPKRFRDEYTLSKKTNFEPKWIPFSIDRCMFEITGVAYSD